MALIKLYTPDYAGLAYGGDNEIQFGIRGGFEPGYCIIDEDHPLLPALLEAEPTVIVVTESGPAKVYICPVHDDKEFKTRNALLSHLRAKGHKGVEAPDEPVDASDDDDDPA